MTEQKKRNERTTLFSRVQEAISALHFGENPLAQENWNKETQIIKKRNPYVGRALGDAETFFPEHWNKFTWGALIAYRSLRLEAGSQNKTLPKLDEQTVSEYLSKVLPIIQRLSRFIEDPKLNIQPIFINSAELQSFIGKFHEKDPETSDRLFEHLGGYHPEDGELIELRETHPAYLGFSYMYLMLKETPQNANGSAPTNRSLN